MSEFLVVRLRFVFGWHVAAVELVEDVLPVLGGVVVDDGPGALVEADLAFLLIGAMAFDAVLVEERLDAFLRDGGRGRGDLGLEGEEEGEEDGDFGEAELGHFFSRKGAKVRSFFGGRGKQVARFL